MFSNARIGLLCNAVKDINTFFLLVLCSTQKPSNESLIRIQNEISEVEKREIELKKEHETVRSTTNGDDVNGHDDHNNDEREQSPEPVVIKFSTKDEFKKNKTVQPTAKPNFLQLPVPGLTRALSTPQLFQVSPMQRFNATSTPQRGIMERFIASRGKIIGNQQRSSIQHPHHQQHNFKNNLMMVSYARDSQMKETWQCEKTRYLRKTTFKNFKCLNLFCINRHQLNSKAATVLSRLLLTSLKSQ